MTIRVPSTLETLWRSSGSKNKSLPVVAWEACDGDSLLALAYVLGQGQQRE